MHGCLAACAGLNSFWLPMLELMKGADAPIAGPVVRAGAIAGFCASAWVAARMRRADREARTGDGYMARVAAQQ
jgi:hypothetical protein